MSGRKFVSTLTGLVLLSLLLAACKSAKASVSETPTGTPASTPALTETPTATLVPSPTATLTPTPAAGPEIRIFYPLAGTQIVAGQQIAIQSVAAADAGVARIELWADGALYATALNPNAALRAMSASQVWSSGVLGDHALAVRAIDNLGRASATAFVTVTVVANPTKPAVWFTEPYAPSGRIVVQSDTNVALEYTATDDAGIARVELWADGQIFAVDTNNGRSTIVQEQHG